MAVDVATPIADEPPSDCGWPLSHRSKHKGSSCSCVCHLQRGHRGPHQCERETADG